METKIARQFVMETVENDRVFIHHCVLFRNDSNRWDTGFFCLIMSPFISCSLDLIDFNWQLNFVKSMCFIILNLEFLHVNCED